MYSHLSNKRDVTLTDFGKFHPAQNKNPPLHVYWFHYRSFNILTELSIFLQNLMMIFLTVILSYKSLFWLKNWQKKSSRFCNFCTPTRLFQPPRLLERWEYLFSQYMSSSYPIWLLCSKIACGQKVQQRRRKLTFGSLALRLIKASLIYIVNT